jgi:CheY-like chemotaxis protein
MSDGYTSHAEAPTASGWVTAPQGRPALEGPRRGAILVVEDREDVRQGLAQLLELHGYLVVDAGTGEEALQQLEQEPDGFALILLDLMLPGAVSGQDIRTRQFADPVLATVPTIIVTASELEPRERARLRPEALLEKPFRFDDLLGLVKRYVVSEGSALQGLT